jgi:3-hydroxyisobutyrate dehydrogenase-like beta-hydroxyacid dehydrogenase
MGAHMARRLVQAGHKVFIYDTRQEAIGNIAALGGIAVRSPKEVADSENRDGEPRHPTSCSRSRPDRTA